MDMFHRFDAIFRKRALSVRADLSIGGTQGFGLRG